MSASLRSILSKSKAKATASTSEQQTFNSNAKQKQKETQLTSQENITIFQLPNFLNYTPLDTNKQTPSTQIDTDNTSSRASSTGFRDSDTESDNWFEPTNNEKENKVDKTPFHPKPNKEPFGPATDWQTEYGRRRYKRTIPLDSLPGHNTDAKLQLLSSSFSHFESFISLKRGTTDGTQTAIAFFGLQKDADKATNLTLHDGTTINLTAALITNPIEAKSKSIRAWDIPLNATTMEVKTTFSKYGQIKNVKLT